MTVRSVLDPDSEAACRFLKASLGARVVVAVARCRIDYQGRAESRLESGERLIVFKPDGTLLVHTAEKLKPVNWQPPGCTFEATIDGALPLVTASRERPKEIVRIHLEAVAAITAFDLDDGEALDLAGTEDDLQALLAKRPDLVEPGFAFWARERSSRRGPMDLYGTDAKGRRVIVEVKRRAAAVQEVEQLRRYVEKERAAREGTTVRGILVAPAVSETAKRYLGELGLEWRELDWERLRRPAKEILRAGQTSLGRFS